MEGHPEQKKWGREMGYQLYFDKKSWDFNSFKISLTNVRPGMGISPFLHGWVIKLGVKCAGEDRGQSGKKYLKKLCSKQNLSPQGKLV